MKHQLIFKEEFPFSELASRVERGGKFIAFSYTISILAVTLRRFSSVYFLSEGQDFERLKRRFNMISRIFGWWCIPWGPLRTIQSIRFNHKGALDLTRDVMLNLTPDDFDRKEVDIRETTLLFEKPEKIDIKAFNKALTKDQSLRLYIEKIVVGLYVNTPVAYFIIGVQTIGDFEQTCRDLKAALYNTFLKSVRFEFLDLSAEHELKESLID